MPQIQILVDPADVEAITSWLSGMERHASRAELLPILMKHMEPVVAAEKAILAPHSKSGALAGSLQARSGGGDRPGTLSVFSAATMSRAALIKAWSGGRAQQRGWASRMKRKGGRRSIFYGVMVEGGHRQVKRLASGQLAEVGSPVAGVHFAAQAMATVGQREADAAAEAIMDHIMGE